MSKLLNAGFMRLFKIKMTYICMIIIAVTNGLEIVIDALTAAGGAPVSPPESYLMSGFIMIVIVSAVFITSFLGSEHSFGTIRNKLVIGRGRTTVYISSFLVCLSYTLILFALAWLFTTVFGSIFMGGYTWSGDELLRLFFLSLLAVIVITAFDTAVALCVQSKSAATASAILAAFIMIMISIVAIQLLSEPEYMTMDDYYSQGYSSMYAEPELTQDGLVKNPNAITGVMRSRYQAAYDLCPVTKMLDDPGRVETKNILIPLGELAILLAGGVWIFRKRDLR